MGKSEQEMPSVTAYTVVPDKEDNHSEQQNSNSVPAYTVTGTAVELDTPAPRTVSHEFAHMAETKELSWRDDFFDDNDDIVAVFDFDYEGMEGHYMCVSWGCVGVTSVCCPSTIPWMLLAFVPCYLNKNVRWNVRAQHIALTTNGILFVHDRRPACWGEQCWSIGKQTKFIPYEQIAGCTVTEGDTTTCAISTNSLTKVTVGSTLHSGPRRGDLEVAGLENPHAFQQLILALKRGSQAAAAPTMAMDDRDIFATAVSGGEDAQTVAELLRDIRDELRQGASRPVASAPEE